MNEEDIIQNYVIAIMENKIALNEVKEEYREEVEKQLEIAMYNECMNDTQY